MLSSNPTCADIDGDVDCVVSSDFDDEFVHLRNDDGVFMPVDSMSSPLYDLRAEDDAKQFAFDDFDNDGDLDVFIGNKYGELYYFVNTDGTYVETAFELSDFDFDGYGDPVFVDLDRDGDNDLVVVNPYGDIFYFEKDGATLSEALFNPFDEVDDKIFKLAFFDRDDDGDLDFIGSTLDGKAMYYQNNDLSSGIEKEFVKEDIKIYPNPVNDVLRYEIDGNVENVSISIYNVEGKKLFSEQSGNKQQIDVSFLPIGTYVVQFRHDSKITNQKFAVIR